MPTDAAWTALLAPGEGRSRLTVIGITGHQSIPEAARQYIIDGLRELLQHQPPPVIGLSSLAAGADQMFAEEVLRVGGSLHVIIPSRRYEDTFSKEGQPHYFELKDQAKDIDVLDYDEPSEEAFDAAGRAITERCDCMIAVWDGKDARGQGGTGDAVQHAQNKGKKVHIIWPEGVTRD